MKFIVVLCLILTPNCYAQEFPNGWVGNYSGDMILGFSNRPNDTIQVDFQLVELEKDSVWTYKMTFHSEKFGEIVKDYRIVAVAKGNQTDYMLDELNGIQMELSYINGTMYGMYDVLGSTYVSTMRFFNDTLILELFAAPNTDPLITATEDDPVNESVEAKSYKPNFHQTAYLHKQQH